MKTLQAEYEKIYGKGDYIPPVKTTFWSFRIMVGAGVVMILAALGGLWLNRRKKLENSKWYLRIMSHNPARGVRKKREGNQRDHDAQIPFAVFKLFAAV